MVTLCLIAMEEQIGFEPKIHNYDNDSDND